MARPNTKSNLVIDQKGSRVVLAGLLFSFLVGLTIKAVFSPARIQFEVERLIEESKPNGKITIERAYLSFANGMWPQLAIVVEGANLLSKDICLGEPEIHVDQINLPVSISSLWQRRIVLEDIELKQFKFKVRSEHKCEQRPMVFEGAQSSPQSQIPETSVKGTPLVQTVSIESPGLSSVHIDSLVFISDFKPGVSLIFEDVNIEVTPSLKKIEASIESNLRIKHASIPNERDIKGVIQLNYKDEALQGNLKGTWREGFFQIGIDAQREKQGVGFSLTGELRHIPLSQILPLMNYYSVSDKNFSGRQSWISSQIQFNRTFTAGQNLSQQEKYEFSQIKFEGEFGEILAPKIAFSQAHPIKVEPFKLELKDVDLEKLLESFDYKNPWGFSAGLGILEGDLNFSDSENVSFKGQVKDSKFIFSNKGRRDILTIEKVNTEMSRIDNRLSVNLSEMKIQDGEFEGRWHMDIFENLGTAKVKAEINKLKLSPRIEALMAGRGGRLGEISGSFEARLDKSVVNELNGQLRVKDGVIDHINFSDLKLAVLKKTPEFWQGNLSFNRLDLTDQADVQKIFKDHQLNLEELSQFDEAQGQFTVFANDSASWKNLVVRNRSQRIKIESLGAWDSKSAIKGELLYSRGKEIKKFIIEGTRRKPLVKADGEVQ